MKERRKSAEMDQKGIKVKRTIGESSLLTLCGVGW